MSVVEEYDPYVEQAFLKELEPTAGTLLERHIEKSKEWFPHEMVSWGDGRDFVPGEDWDPTEFPLDDATRSALFVNLLTEDNLPFYFRTIERMFGANDAWGEWARRWTAEEGRHSIVIRDYLTIHRAIDPVELERARMQQVSRGQVPEPATAADGIAYVTLQELATRVAHRNTGKRLADQGSPEGQEVMKRVGSDENFHYLFYRDLGKAALEQFPDIMIPAIERQVEDFEMPGTGIIGFKAHAKRIADADIYNLLIHYDDILLPVIKRHWKLDELTDLKPETEASVERIFSRMERIRLIAGRLASRQLKAQDSSSSTT